MSDITLSAAVVVRGKRRVVDGIGFDVPRGTWFGVIGANGSGKTSLLRALAGRLPLAAGICRVDGRDLAADRAARARSFGFCPPADQLPDLMRGRELLDYARCGAVTDHRWLAAVWSALGIADLSDRWIGDCSAGMRQRLAIACAFVGGHTRIILDEPFNWLDPVAAYDLRQVLRAMVNDGLTLVTALHDLPVLAGACDAGVILADGTVAATLDRERLQEAAVDPQAFERAMIDRLRSGR